MGMEEEKGFDFNIPVVANRREFFEQEAVLSDPPGELENDLGPDEIAESLKAMREAAAERTAAPEPEP